MQLQMFVVDPASDADQPLTPRARRRWKRTARSLESLGVRFDRLYHAPSQNSLDAADTLVGLMSGGRPERAQAADRVTGPWLARLEGDCIAIVGEPPWLGECLALLLGAGGDRCVLEKGMVAWLEGEPRPAGMKLRGLLPSSVLSSQP